MIWVLRIGAPILILFFLGPAVYFVFKHDWAMVVNNVLCICMLITGWIIMEDRRKRQS